MTPGSRVGRPPAFDGDAYVGRNVFEHCFNRLEQWRGIGTKHVRNYRDGMMLAGILIWLK